MSNPCEGCPFTDPGPVTQNIIETLVSMGHWVPCKQTVTLPEPQGFSEKIAAWHREEECAGARAFRKSQYARA
jgi:hypothetical protein